MRQALGHRELRLPLNPLTTCNILDLDEPSNWASGTLVWMQPICYQKDRPTHTMGLVGPGSRTLGQKQVLIQLRMGLLF